MKRTIKIYSAGLVLVLAASMGSCKQARYSVNKPGIASAPPTDNSTKAPDDQIKNDPDGTTFGTTGVFHLGDGLFGGSSCKPQLEALPLSGTRFNFTFNVTADNTPVTILVADLCGVDLDTDTVVLAGNGVDQPPMPIPVNASTVQVPSLTLNKGTYVLTITAGHNVNNPQFVRGHVDDFIVGHVQVQGANIQGVSYDAQP